MWAVLQHEGAQLAERGRFAKAESRRREGERTPTADEERKVALFNFISAFRSVQTLLSPLFCLR